MNRKQEISTELDRLISERDAGRREAQVEIDALMDELEQIVIADATFQAKQAKAAWDRACINTALWA